MCEDGVVAHAGATAESRSSFRQPWVAVGRCIQPSFLSARVHQRLLCYSTEYGVTFKNRFPGDCCCSVGEGGIKVESTANSRTHETAVVVVPQSPQCTSGLQLQKSLEQLGFDKQSLSTRRAINSMRCPHYRLMTQNVARL